jgi:hypothetical protein
MRALIAGLGCSLALLGAQTAAAQTETRTAVAEALYRQARDLMAAGNYDEACPKLAESQRLDPGGGTLLNLAVCHEAVGKIATAWSEFHEALSLARRDGRTDRDDLAKERIAALAGRLPRLIIDVSAASRLVDLAIELDGALLGRPTWGSALPVDPGRHTVVTTAPGRVRWERQVDVAVAEALRVEIPALSPAAPPSARVMDKPARPIAPPPLPSSPSLSHAGQLGAVARVDIDYRGRGAAVTLGASYGVGAHLEVVAGAVVGGQSGLYAGASLLPIVGPLKPTLSLGVPVFFKDGAYPGAHGSLGVQWDLGRHFGAFLQGGVEYFPTAPEGYEKVLPVPSFGLQGRL